MTLEEAQSGLPNGFREARIQNVTFDAQERTAQIGLAVYMGTVMERPAAEDIYRAGELRFRGVDRFSAEKLHGKLLPIEWSIRSVEMAPDDQGDPSLHRYTFHLGFKEQLVVVAEQASFDWIDS
ncbi:MAG TPA: hypothetical protein VGN16_21400 [Acidobacteriaceae bacterium]